MTDLENKPRKGELSHGDAHALAALLDTQDGAVVSRTLLRRGTGNITLFSFDAGQGLSEHTAPFDAFVLMLEGEVELTIGGDPVKAAAGDAVIMPAGIPHAVNALTPLKMLLVMIREPKESGAEKE